MENEIWKEIPGYEGLYEVSNYGQIRSIKRLEKCGNKTRIRKERILKQSLRRGYLFVSLCKNGEKVKREVLVHGPKPIFAPDAEPENKVAKLLNETDF